MPRALKTLAEGSVIIAVPMALLMDPPASLSLSLFLCHYPLRFVVPHSLLFSSCNLNTEAPVCVSARTYVCVCVRESETMAKAY